MDIYIKCNLIFYILIGETAVVEEQLQVLENIHVGDTSWSIIEGHWKDTTKARLRYLYYEDGTVHDYLKRFQILQNPKGYLLLVNDFNRIYPNQINNLIKIRDCTKKIIELATIKASTTKDVLIKTLINNYIETINGEIYFKIYLIALKLEYCLIIKFSFVDNDIDSEVNAAFLLLPFIVKYTPSRKSGKSVWRASKTETRDGFITQVPTEADVLTTIEERKVKLSKFKESLQPFIIFTGESLRNIQTVCIVCEDTLYKSSNLFEAVDHTFKIIHATGAKYPQESYDIWLLIQLGFYNITTTYDRISAGVKAVLVDLGFKDKITI